MPFQRGRRNQAEAESSGGLPPLEWPGTREEYDDMTADVSKSKEAGWGKLVARSGRPFADDDDIIVFHGTDNEHADQFKAEGIDPENKEVNIAQAGEGEYAPGRGISRGTYVGMYAQEVDGYGGRTLAIRTKLSHIKPSPEKRQLESERVPVTNRMALLHNDAVIEEPIHRDNIREVGAPRRVTLAANEWDELEK